MLLYYISAICMVDFMSVTVLCLYYSIKISVFTLYTLVFYALQWKSSAHLPWCVTHTVWVCKAHYYKVCFALSASKCALHTKKSVRIETCPAHLIWCAQHTTVFTVYFWEKSLFLHDQVVAWIVFWSPTLASFPGPRETGNEASTHALVTLVDNCRDSGLLLRLTHI